MFYTIEGMFFTCHPKALPATAQQLMSKLLNLGTSLRIKSDINL